MAFSSAPVRNVQFRFLLHQHDSSIQSIGLQEDLHHPKNTLVPIILKTVPWRSQNECQCDFTQEGCLTGSKQIREERRDLCWVLDSARDSVPPFLTIFRPDRLLMIKSVLNPRKGQGFLIRSENAQGRKQGPLLGSGFFKRSQRNLGDSGHLFLTILKAEHLLKSVPLSK
jgi:hypothetical protein